ncbi:class E sortase [Candidatus Saccharibacteria bacterium]|nr:class E sortase [Candidatus Saccharibacteria bacterium]
MDDNTGGQNASDLARQAAAEIARKKVLAAYTERARNSENAKNSPAAGVSHLKDTPVESKINSESWKRYHSAWQDYYQKYYSEYYSNAARQYIAKERLKEARERADEEEIAQTAVKIGKKNPATTGLAINDGSALSDSDDARSILRRKIRRKATDNAKRTRKFKKFIPIAAGLTVTGMILFLQYNRLIFAPIMAYVSPGNAPATEIEAIDPTITQTVSSDPRLIIPKLNIDVPINFGVPLSDVMEAMNHGVAHYRISGASAYPGQVGNFIITGHSAGDVYSSNQYKYIFSGLERLEDGDLIYVNYESVRYTYQVFKKEIVEPSNVAALVVQTDKPLITLVTCTPLGTSRYRLLVTGEQISPVYDESKRAEEDASTATPVIDEGVALPANEPSFFENIWNWLTGR